MRIKNKELRQRRHRKEQRVKEAHKELKKLHENKPAAAPVAKAPAPKKEAAKKETAPKAKAPAAEVAEKPKKAPAKKKAETEE
jgi:hypothetical protein